MCWDEYVGVIHCSTFDALLNKNYANQQQRNTNIVHVIYLPCHYFSFHCCNIFNFLQIYHHYFYMCHLYVRNLKDRNASVISFTIFLILIICNNLSFEHYILSIDFSLTLILLLLKLYSMSCISLRFANTQGPWRLRKNISGCQIDHLIAVWKYIFLRGTY